MSIGFLLRHFLAHCLYRIQALAAKKTGAAKKPVPSFPDSTCLFLVLSIALSILLPGSQWYSVRHLLLFPYDPQFPQLCNN